jgi:DNA-binding NarL/FixJ family response regulator
VHARVLIIDDNIDFRAALRQLLERNGFAVVAEAGDAATGVREATTQRPDLVIVDVQLPDGDGFQVAELLSGLELALGVILTSSLDGGDFGALVTTTSALGFIPKAEFSASAIEALLAATR